jgi:hypothetical protein
MMLTERYLGESISQLEIGSIQQKFQLNQNIVGSAKERLRKQPKSPSLGKCRYFADEREWRRLLPAAQPAVKR